MNTFNIDKLNIYLEEILVQKRVSVLNYPKKELIQREDFFKQKTQKHDDIWRFRILKCFKFIETTNEN